MQKKLFILTLLAHTALTQSTTLSPEQTASITAISTIKEQPALKTSAPSETLLKITHATPSQGTLSSAVLTPSAQSDPAASTIQSPKRIVTVTNNIKPEMTIYKHWIAGNLEPKPFKILIDGKELEPGKTATVAIENKTLPIQFSYSFMDGYKKGTNEVTFEVPENQDKLAMTFSWDNQYRVILDHAKALKKEEVTAKKVPHCPKAPVT